MYGLTFVPALLRGDRPEKPLHAKSLGFSDTLWELVRMCWSESTITRPTAQELFDNLSLVAPTWSPPKVYPAITADFPCTTDSELDSFGALKISLHQPSVCSG